MPLEVRLVVSAQEGLRCRLQKFCEAASARMEGEDLETSGVCRSSPPGDLMGWGWACRLLPAASDVIRSEVKPFGVWCNWQHD